MGHVCPSQARGPSGWRERSNPTILQPYSFCVHPVLEPHGPHRPRAAMLPCALLRGRILQHSAWRVVHITSPAPLGDSRARFGCSWGDLTWVKANLGSLIQGLHICLLPHSPAHSPPHRHLFANCASGEGREAEEETKSKLRKQDCSSKGPAQQSSDKAVIKPDYHARQPRLDWNATEEPKSCQDCLQHRELI